jgi:hypothetical protein
MIKEFAKLYYSGFKTKFGIPKKKDKKLYS